MLALANTFKRTYKPHYYMAEGGVDKMLTHNLSLR